MQQRLVRENAPSVGSARFSSPKTAHCPLTLGNVGGSPTPGNHTAETGLAGWGARIRTWEWRNQNPQNAIDTYSLSALMLHPCRIKRVAHALRYGSSPAAHRLVVPPHDRTIPRARARPT